MGGAVFDGQAFDVAEFDFAAGHFVFEQTLKDATGGVSDCWPDAIAA